MASSNTIQPIASLYGTIYMTNVAYKDVISSNEANKIMILPDGSMIINSITMDKLIDSETTDVVLFGGNA